MDALWLNSRPPILHGCLDKQPIWSHVPPGHSLAGIDFYFYFLKRAGQRSNGGNLLQCVQDICTLYEKKGTLAASWFIGLAQEGGKKLQV